MSRTAWLVTAAAAVGVLAVATFVGLRNRRAHVDFQALAATTDWQEIECRYARISALRLPHLRPIWKSFGAPNRRVDGIEGAATRFAQACVEERDTAITQARHEVKSLSTAVAIEYAGVVGVKNREAILLIEERLRDAVRGLYALCEIPENPLAMALNRAEFDASLQELALGQCPDEPFAGSSESEGGSVPGGFPGTLVGSVRECMTGFLEADRVRREEAASCGGKGGGIAPVVGNVNRDRYTYTDGEGNEHVVTVSSSEGEATWHDVECNGACELNEEGEPTNVASDESVTIRERDDGSTYATVIDEEGVTGREVDPGDQEVNTTDETGGSTEESATSPELEQAVRDLICKEQGDCAGYPGPDCMVATVAAGLNVTYLVSGSGALTSKEDRLAPTLLDALDQCTCESTKELLGNAASGPFGSMILGSSCMSQEDEERMNCLRVPFGPDDAPKCAQYATVDMAEIAQGAANLQCSMMQCPGGSAVGLVNADGSQTCACVSTPAIEGAFQGFASAACQQMMCAGGSCSCGASGCGCRESGDFFMPGSMPGLEGPIPPPPGEAGDPRRNRHQE